MELPADEVIALLFDSAPSAGVFAAATVMALVFVSGLGARAIEWYEIIGRARLRR